MVCLSLHLVFFCCIMAVAQGATQWKIVAGWNAVPGVMSGLSEPHSTESSATACQQKCASNATCRIFSYNSVNGHCFWHMSGTWSPIDSSTATSGCIVAPPELAVTGCDAQSPAASPAPAPLQTLSPSVDLPLLFMDTLDVADIRGLVRSRANTVMPEPAGGMIAPALDYDNGAIIFGCLRTMTNTSRGMTVPAVPATWELYGSNATGYEPLMGSGHQDSAKEKKKTLTVNVWRFMTRDFRTYTAPMRVLSFESGGDPYPYSMPTVKSITRDEQSGRTLLAVFGNGINFYVSTDGGRSFAPTTGGSPPAPAFEDKDDINVMWSRQSGHFVDMQITKQNWTLPYCDNLKGCDHRRVVSARVSPDGGESWGGDLGLRVPDLEDDPPELQFYRTRPFYLGAGMGGDSNRLLAHTLLYAPSPWVSAAYGRQPPNCQKASEGGNPHACHAPHMYEEWWVGPQSGVAEDVAGWRRPCRETAAAPRDAWLMAQPATLQDVAASAEGQQDSAVQGLGRHVWVGNGQVYTLPLFRVAGLYAPANAEFSTPPFRTPNALMASGAGGGDGAGLVINADARWGRALRTGGCDEGCAAYIMAELRDAQTGRALPGFERNSSIPILNATGTQLPLLWQRSSTAAMALRAGTNVTLRVFFRDATVYAVGWK